MKSIIFDFDGVIHDTFELAYRINSRIEKDKLSRDQYREIFMGNIYNHKIITPEKSQKFFALQNNSFKYLKLEKEMEDFLEKINKDYNLFIISSNQEQALNYFFQSNNFTHIFKEVLGQETHQSKIKKFELIFDKYNFTAEDSLFITDTLGDILEGHKVGIRTIAVDFGFHSKTTLLKGKPFKIVSDLQTLEQSIRQSL